MNKLLKLIDKYIDTYNIKEYPTYIKNTFCDLYNSLIFNIKNHNKYNKLDIQRKIKYVFVNDPIMWYGRLIISVSILDYTLDKSYIEDDENFCVYIDTIDDLQLRKMCESLKEAKELYKKIPLVVSYDNLINMGFIPE